MASDDPLRGWPHGGCIWQIAIVDAHGGKLTLSARDGVGTRATCTLSRLGTEIRWRERCDRSVFGARDIQD
ncbi:hypothetical protein CA601_41640 [Paraburkholderia hospita]|nr:hypothetical protein CA601_41640 [Paraburkholderia hospita]OUL86123.1 hypothetical protein CA603_22825 [Paraburkholderia hospita]